MSGEQGLIELEGPWLLVDADGAGAGLFAPEVVAVDVAVAPPDTAMPGVVFFVPWTRTDGPAAGEDGAIGGEDREEEGFGVALVHQADVVGGPKGKRGEE